MSKDNISFLNKNGLINGIIPANTACPFTNECMGFNEYCPQEGKLHDHGYSCAIARAFSLTKIE